MPRENKGVGGCNGLRWLKGRGSKQKMGWGRGWWDQMLGQLFMQGNKDWSLTSVAFFNMLRKSEEEENGERRKLLTDYHERSVNSALFSPYPEICENSYVCVMAHKMPASIVKHFQVCWGKKLLMATVIVCLSPWLNKAMSVSAKSLNFGLLWLNALWLGPMPYR